MDRLGTPHELLEMLHARAAEDLWVRRSGEPAEPWVWEHACRVAQLAEQVANVPELVGRVVNKTALQVAALYHDVGWVLRAHAGQVRPMDLLLKPASAELREQSANWMRERLQDLLGPGVLELAARTIRHCHDRNSNLLEAHILSEADHLDEVGPHAFLMTHRKQLADGRTFADLLTVWRRQEEYHYWEARVKEFFRYESTRLIARRRLSALRQMMALISANDTSLVLHSTALPA